MTLLENATAAELRAALANRFDADCEAAGDSTLVDPAEYFPLADCTTSTIRAQIADRGMLPTMIAGASNAELAYEVNRRGIASIAEGTTSAQVQRLARAVFENVARQGAPRGPFATEEARSRLVQDAARYSPLSQSRCTPFVRLATGRHNGVPAQILAAIDAATPRTIGTDSTTIAAPIDAAGVTGAARELAATARRAAALGATPGGSSGTQWSTTE